jgi:hypothetical protein
LIGSRVHTEEAKLVFEQLAQESLHFAHVEHTPSPREIGIFERFLIPAPMAQDLFGDSQYARKPRPTQSAR